MIQTIYKLCVGCATLVSRRLKETLPRIDFVIFAAGPPDGTQERHNMDIEDGNQSLSRIVDTTRTQLGRHREAGVSDEDFVLKLMTEFINLRGQMSSNAGSLHMALSIYRLALMTEYIEELEEKVAFHKAAVEFLLELDEFESI